METHITDTDLNLGRDTERGRGRGAPPIGDRNVDRAPGCPPVPPMGRGTTGGGFMSPLRRVMETAERVFKADYQPSPPTGTCVPLLPSQDELEHFVDAPIHFLQEHPDQEVMP